MDTAIEHVARAFYDAQDDAHSWDREPEILKEEFRRYAREAIALLRGKHADAQQDDLVEGSEALLYAVGLEGSVGAPVAA
ncbi:hypothetical protein [Microvirga lenta]|uniref:hypothetical protein n=1 Tax=Microvirga lenta TaxID=2881337 RepID=UPI001CFF9AEE|nr:hypothetical protein [Microvirga lenta]MCB5176056.1 hypothetical protein [Microvirga lenta]